jgi:hypothetical protein
MRRLAAILEKRHRQLTAEVDMKDPMSVAEFYVSMLPYNAFAEIDNLENIGKKFMGTTALILALVSHSIGSMPRVRYTPVQVLEIIVDQARRIMVEKNLHVSTDLDDPALAALAERALRGEG